MKKLIFSLLFSLNVASGFGQVSLEKISLENGKYKVGFQHYLVSDSTRTYNRIFDWSNEEIYRPIPISIWYPAETELSEGTPLNVLTYMQILKEEEEWEHLPNEQILNWFQYPNNEGNRKHLQESTTAFLDAERVAKKFPVILYAPSYQASSIENFALCEFLASHGFVIIASPSRGTENRFFEGGTAKDMETQARDIEFLIKELSKHKNIDHDKIATVGYSFGGLSNVLSQMRNGKIKAIVSLDGSIKYQYATLQKSSFAKVENVNVPFIHMAQKNIPKAVMIEDKIDSTLNNEFVFYDSLVNSKAYSLKFNYLTHSYFSTLGVLFQTRDKRQDKSDAEIMESYKWMSLYTLNFLNAFLKDSSVSLDFLNSKPEDNGVPPRLISKKSKSPLEKPLTFEGFNDMAARQSYMDLDKLYESVVQENATFQLAEGKLNNLGLQLVFNPETSEQGINVFILATKIYPESSNLFDSLAEGYLFIGNNKRAIENFEKSLKLNPHNQNAINRLKELKG